MGLRKQQVPETAAGTPDRPLAIPPRTSARRFQQAQTAAERSSTSHWNWLAATLPWLVFIFIGFSAMAIANSLSRAWFNVSFTEFRQSLVWWANLTLLMLCFVPFAPVPAWMERWLTRKFDTRVQREIEQILQEHLCVSCRHPLAPPPASTAAAGEPPPDVRCPECGHEQPYD